MHEIPAISILASGSIALCVAWMLATGKIPAPLAQPNPRSLHTVPVPRVGGIAIWAGWLISWSAVQVSAVWVAPLALIIAVSWADDVRALPAVVRLLVHAIAAAIAAALFLGAGWPVIIFYTMVIVWMANLYNFMDGADGLAGSMGVAGFGAYSAAALLAGRIELAVLCGALAAACAGFLAFNRPPARLFMGDVGAVALGFVAALFGIEGFTAGTWPWWFPPLVFAPFIVDATATLLRRIARRERLASAHRDHFYQRAILVDGAHARTVRAYVGWMIAGAALALAGLRWAPDAGLLLLVAATAGFGWYCWTIERRWIAWNRVRHAG